MITRSAPTALASRPRLRGVCGIRSGYLQAASLGLITPAVARDSIDPLQHRFPAHYRRGLEQLHADIEVVLRYLDAGPVHRTLWRWGAGR